MTAESDAAVTTTSATTTTMRSTSHPRGAAGRAMTTTTTITRGAGRGTGRCSDDHRHPEPTRVRQRPLAEGLRRVRRARGGQPADVFLLVPAVGKLVGRRLVLRDENDAGPDAILCLSPKTPATAHHPTRRPVFCNNCDHCVRCLVLPGLCAGPRRGSGPGSGCERVGTVRGAIWGVDRYRYCHFSPRYPGDVHYGPVADPGPRPRGIRGR